MSRLSSAGEPIIVKPSNNVYTALAVVGFVVVLIGLIVLFAKGAFSSGT